MSTDRAVAGRLLDDAALIRGRRVRCGGRRRGEAVGVGESTIRGVLVSVGRGVRVGAGLEVIARGDLLVQHGLGRQAGFLQDSIRSLPGSGSLRKHQWSHGRRGRGGAGRQSQGNRRRAKEGSDDRSFLHGQTPNSLFHSLTKNLS